MGGLMVSFWVVALAIIATAFVGSKLYPPINDITTDPQNPVEWLKKGRRYKKHFAAIQASRYPEIKPLVLRGFTAAAVYDVAKYLAANFPLWNYEERIDSEYTIQCVSATPLLKFKDDVVIRIVDSTEEP